MCVCVYTFIVDLYTNKKYITIMKKTGNKSRIKKIIP